MDIIVRGVRPDELDTVGEITAEAYLGDRLLTYGEKDPYLKTLRDARHRAEHAEVLVAADAASDRVVGAVAFAAHGTPYAELAQPGEGEFRMLAVARAARRRGAAEALVRACLDRARSLGLEHVVICSQQTMHTAHRLYERLGFIRLPERDWEPVPGVSLLAFTVAL
ncbi:GNAT family N-acetyltransferase [Streptomyces sp. RB6PN25]|uniref:GNAT family N-acetyltransferase n=1 Tax=Streptomyces humicola TaxID=2953240 RepID=A0ABT1PRK4_9ACTN|nr:GNAT family N-acetyltransferase [Streptomyces humicola]MCQ4080291.1 GNAT family N-acetyltransferase [Streptomyces humicola]